MSLSHSAKEWGRKGLRPSARAIATAALGALLADARGGADPGWCERVVASYDLGVGAASVQVRIGINALLWLLELLPLVVLGKPRRMSRLALADRVRFFERLECHSLVWLTVLHIAIKVPLTISAYEEGDALRRTGFDRPTTAARRLPRLREGS